ncbi:MAG TPA: lipid biosynthesis B12-binding/radical SAM protein [Candidatus Polarisedimenticolia bacterium]|nr:lipid biosynthesis B12-binding/radical SAM protein [Candidatus Polarisedimenticolia bacterium]
MPSRVLLISANTCTVPCAVFPLGLAQLNAALRAAGHETKWFDCLSDSEPIEQIVAAFQPHVVGVSLRNIDDVAIRKRETFYGSLLDLCASIRRCSRARIVVGGSGFSIFPERLLEMSGADFGIQGEGEAGFLALLGALEEGGDPRGIPGLVFREEGAIRRNPQSPDRLDRVVSPEDRPQRLVDDYLERSLMLNLQTQRGCSFECCYCTYPLIEGRRHRRRPSEMVAEELAELSARGARYVSIVDSVFNSSPRHVVETCEAILQRGVRIQWGCFLRPQGLTTGQMRIMARAGLTHIEFGSDSFSDRVLEAYCKNLRFDEIHRAAELAAAEKVAQCHFLILGGPGETEETIEETLANSRSLPGVVVLPVVGMRVYPGTTLHARAIAEGCITQESDLLEPCHYIAPGLTAEYILNRLAGFARTDARWIIGEPPASFDQLVVRLRRRGVVGPLWTYFAMLQRLSPSPPAGGMAP